MARPPDEIILRRDRDLSGRTWHPWIRRSLLALLAVLPVLALANAFGQHQSALSATSASATLTVNAPSRVRGGLALHRLVHVQAHSELKKATLVLDPGWIDGMQVNSINPQPIDEASRNRKVVLVVGRIASGQRVEYWIEFQVNPTTMGRRNQNVELEDGSKHILTEQGTLTIYPRRAMD